MMGYVMSFHSVLNHLTADPRLMKQTSRNGGLILTVGVLTTIYSQYAFADYNYSKSNTGCSTKDLTIYEQSIRIQVRRVKYPCL
jgi:hypothetical protein